MRRRVWMLLTALALAGCAHGPRVVRVSAEELGERLAREFPVDRRLLEVFDVHVSAPRVRTEPETRRLRAEFRVQAEDRLGGLRLDTRLAVVAGLRWEPRDRTLRLERVDLDLPARGERDESLARRLGAVLAARLLEDRVVWRAPGDAALAVQRITVTGSGLELELAR